MFLNVVIRPILLPVFFFFALTLAVVFSKLIIAGLEIFVDGQTANTWYFTPTALFTWAWRMFLATYLFVMAFKLSHEIMAKSYDYVMRFVNAMGRGDYSTDAPNSDMMGKGMAFATGASAMVASPLKTIQKKMGNSGQGQNGQGGGNSNNEDTTSSDRGKITDPPDSGGDNGPKTDSISPGKKNQPH